MEDWVTSQQPKHTFHSLMYSTSTLILSLAATLQCQKCQLYRCHILMRQHHILILNLLHKFGMVWPFKPPAPKIEPISQARNRQTHLDKDTSLSQESLTESDKHLTLLA